MSIYDVNIDNKLAVFQNQVRNDKNGKTKILNTARLVTYSIHSKQNYQCHSLKKQMQIRGRPHYQCHSLKKQMQIRGRPHITF